MDIYFKIFNYFKMNPFKAFFNVLKNHISERSISDLAYRWNEKHRFYHNISHLIQIIQDIQNDMYFKELGIYEKQALLLACFMHDAIYDPKKRDNEDQSIRYFRSIYIGEDSKMLNAVCDLIEVTKHRKRPYDRLKRIFWDADNSIFKKGFDEILKNEKLIEKEYSFFSREEYKQKRIQFLSSNIGLFGRNSDQNINKLIEYVKKL